MKTNIVSIRDMIKTILITVFFFCSIAWIWFRLPCWCCVATFSCFARIIQKSCLVIFLAFVFTCFILDPLEPQGKGESKAGSVEALPLERDEGKRKRERERARASTNRKHIRVFNVRALNLIKMKVLLSDWSDGSLDLVCTCSTL